MTFFFYGTLRHPPILRAVLGRAAATRPAVLPDFRTVWAAEYPVPILVPEADAEAAGLVLEHASAEDRARLDYYEAGFGYELMPCTVLAGGAPVPAQVYLPDDAVYSPADAFDLDDWVARFGAEGVAGAEDFMSLWPEVPRARAVAMYPQILQRAASRLRAARTAPPVVLRRGGPASGVRVLQRRVPYQEYFRLDEQDLTFPRFRGGDSAVVQRAAFVGGDAVTVLPYDPVRDRVLLVEQFRFGAHVRGDPLPWTLEPIAGRIDGGEDPEQTARRETREEAGLELGRLIPIGACYPAPGATTEYIYSFIGLADLPDSVAGYGGLDSEAEDLRVLLLSFDALMALVDSGEADTGPTRLSALELARRRESLRRG